MPPGPKRRGRQNPKSENSFTSIKSGNQLKDTLNEKNEWPDLRNSNQAALQEQKRRNVSRPDQSAVPDEISRGVNRQDVNVASVGASQKQEEEESCMGKYSKRPHFNNWDRYNEAAEMNGDDEEQGADFETLLSYSGGCGTQFRLHDENEWEDNISEVGRNDFLSIDCNALASALQCVPLHKRLGLPEGALTPDILSKFQNAAELHCRQYRPVLKKNDYNDCKSPAVQTETVAKVQPTQILDKLDINKPSSLAKTTAVSENLIESLTSCLSLKEMGDLQSDGTSFSEKPKLIETVTNEQPTDIADGDLNFLLSLSSKPPTKLPQSSSKRNTEIAAKKSIDEWLDSVLGE